MSRCIHYVNLYVIVHNRAVLGINCNSSFSFDVVAVHNAVDNLFIRSEYAALIQESIDQSGLSGIDVRNHSYVDNLLFLTHVCLPSFVEILTISRKIY